MKAIVRIAIDRPLTFIVMAIAIAVAGVLAAFNTPTDIFPEIKVPVLGVAWQYAGLSPQNMANRVTNQFERILTTTVDDVEHIESQSLPGISIVKIFFQPGADIRTATAQVTAISQSAARQMPTGTTPPLILNYSAATVPILQLAQTSPTLSEQQLFDLSQTVLRPALVSVPGAATPFPYGGRQRQIAIDLDPEAMRSKGVSAQDVSNAIAAQNQIIPAGTVKIDEQQYFVQLNNAAETMADFNNIPIKSAADGVIFMKDVGQARDGSAVQTNIVHVDGGRAVLTTILKKGSASTLAIVDGVKARLPKVKEQLPSDMKIVPMNDQSLFVKGAIDGVLREGVIAAALTSLMILLFLGSWRSTSIIAVSIPLSVLAAVAGLSAVGQSFNIMTLGGLALAVGILVDDATVTIENINWHLEQGKDVRTAILDGADQIVTPAFVSLLCICIVFVPMFLLKGVAGFLFVPMAMAVVFAMIASFILSRTLVPTLAMYLLKPHDPERLAYEAAEHGAAPAAPPSRNPFVRLQRRFESGFDAFRAGYRRLLATAMDHRRAFVIGMLAFVSLSFLLVPFLGSNFFPSVDSGQIVMHVRGPAGLRLEETSRTLGQIETVVRQTIPQKELASIVDNIGVPNSSINLVYNNSGTVGPQDADVYISLKPEHGPTADYVKTLRELLPARYPAFSFSFLPADIVSQILNFGAPAPIDVQVSGPNAEANRAYAAKVLRRMRAIPGLADVRMQQPANSPELRVDVDRSRMTGLGLTERDVTNTLVASIAGTSQVSPTYWVNPKTGVSYSVVAQTPEYKLGSLSDLSSLPITAAGSAAGLQTVGGLGQIKRQSSASVVSHYDLQPVIDIYATTQGRDLGGVAKDVRKILKATAKEVPKGSTVVLRGQVVTMDSAFAGLFAGLAAAIVLIYLLIVVNFQSWLDPFVIITALPAALAGIVWTLFATGTNLSVPALTGAIMCMGVATANSILVVSFARERLAATGDAVTAAIEAGFTRFRPVIMTALAMVIGMAPMALGLGEGGEQNAPLGRAVIGGLIFATASTLMFVPVVFSMVHGRKAAARAPLSAGEAYA